MNTQHTDVFKQLKKANKERCPEFGHGGIDGWSLTDWACAVAGETGEMCNLIKKMHRGDNIKMEDVGKEAADIVIYLDMLCQRAGIDLQTAIVNKFNEVSERIGSDINIYYY